MAKMISVMSFRHGVGRSTFSSLLALELAKNKKKVLILDNNYKYCNIDQLLIADSKYSSDDIKPFLDSNSLSFDIFKEFLVKISDYLFFLPGSKVFNITDILTSENLKEIKEKSKDFFDYIIIDHRAGLDHIENIEMAYVSDHSFIIIAHDASYKKDYSIQFETLDEKEQNILNKMVKNSILIVNKYAFDDFKPSEYERIIPVNKVIPFYYSTDVASFANGYKYTIKGHNQQSLNEILSIISGKDDEETELKKQSRIKGIFKK